MEGSGDPPPDSGGLDVSRVEAAALLRSATTLVLYTHRNPDGDSVGCVTALAAALKSLGKGVRLVCPDPLPHYLLAVPGSTTITTGPEAVTADLVVSIDVSDPGLLAPLEVSQPGYFRGVYSLNIDHHFSNTRYARHNLVDHTAAAATEIVYDLIQELGLPLDHALATSLMYGIVNDTHSFQNSNTTPRTLAMSSELVAAGANLSGIVFDLLLVRSPASARLWALVLPTLLFHDDERVAFLTVSQDTLARAGAAMTDADGLVEFLRNIRDVDLAVLFKETDTDTYRLSMRASTAVDATVIAGAFGGGGHQRAAGCDISAPLASAQAGILAEYLGARQAG
ncbi:MAG TPA: bifunctional oligoribonuclease/PAP phosphatase NrnA [Chloroflexota bacterium]|nr:bifunctional oligoribonuclease/PAP phosphatase NrnA [Chloroflexota bacterium]